MFWSFLASLFLFWVMPLGLAQAQCDISIAEKEARPVPCTGVKADKSSYALDSSVQVTFIAENRTRQDMTLRFPSSKQYDVWVEKDGREVWRWSNGRMFTQAFTSLTLKPRERKSFSVTWDQVDNQGKKIGPGTYTLNAQLMTVPPRPFPVSTTVTVGDTRAAVAPTTVRAIIDNSGTMNGKLVSLDGTYKGWRPDSDSPACKSGPSVTRSDWAFSDRTGCIYVTGRSGLDPRGDFGKRITLVGTVRKTDKGQVYIQAQSVTVVNQ